MNIIMHISIHIHMKNTWFLSYLSENVMILFWMIKFPGDVIFSQHVIFTPSSLLRSLISFNFYSSVIPLFSPSGCIKICLWYFIMRDLGMDLFSLTFAQNLLDSLILNVSNSETVSNVLPLNLPSPHSLFLKLLP